MKRGFSTKNLLTVYTYLMVFSASVLFMSFTTLVVTPQVLSAWSAHRADVNRDMELACNSMRTIKGNPGIPAGSSDNCFLLIYNVNVPVSGPVCSISLQQSESQLQNIFGQQERRKVHAMAGSCIVSNL